ncbi:uncharacterized protein LTR77_008062 [Saxophila tyrrhenica]|uniref:Thymidylate kinase n=1 Tax=Saxophila tyrrhenica TaxID=1690608 RepID=A0AAV9P2B6_9PEZI|nr:hypothetical protein LTR77_008062 [Saxophila tyrrhenica]
MARVPFAPLDSPRLQHLVNAKNRQNGLLAQKTPSIGKPSVSLNKTLSSPAKRTFDATDFDENDSENVDPAILFSPSKKSKSDGMEKASKPFTFSLTPSSKSMPPPPTIPSRLSTPARANISSPRAPMTAPAGRSPKRKTTGVNKNRRVSAPFTRIDPPFASRGFSTLPFSLDAALNGTFSTPSAPKSTSAAIQEASMPKTWFFDIYEDTPEEAAATLMEHSTLTLDLSSDEESQKKEKDGRGKENMPPEGYDAPTASRAVSEPVVAAPKRVRKGEIVRRKVVGVDEMDDGERGVLSVLETEDFIPEGLSKDSHVIVNAAVETTVVEEKKSSASSLFAAPVDFTSGAEKKSAASTPAKGMRNMPVVNADGDLKGDIIIWEDSASSESPSSPSVQQPVAGTLGKGLVADENAPPTDENDVVS